MYLPTRTGEGHGEGAIRVAGWVGHWVCLVGGEGRSGNWTVGLRQSGRGLVMRRVMPGVQRAKCGRAWNCGGACGLYLTKHKGIVVESSCSIFRHQRPITAPLPSSIAHFRVDDHILYGPLRHGRFAFHTTLCNDGSLGHRLDPRFDRPGSQGAISMQPLPSDTFAWPYSGALLLQLVLRGRGVRRHLLLSLQRLLPP